MKILVACEFSGVVREALKAKGHDAWSCDLLPTEQPGKHIQADIFEVLSWGWDMMIAHPPCTYLCNSGVCWLKNNPSRWHLMKLGSEFFTKLLNADIPRIAVENPIMHGHAKKIIGEAQSQTVQPYMFGHPERKATCLWLRNLPPLAATKNVYDEMMALPKKERERLHYLSPGPDRAKLRSKTFEGIALAMADQWGQHA